MSNTLAIISGSAAFLFLLVVLNMIRLKRKEYSTRIEGNRALIKRTKRLKEKRKKLFKETKELEVFQEDKIEHLWLNEIELPLIN